MATATATRPFITGFCGRRNPQDSHRRCPTTLLGLPCSCDCHVTALVEASTAPATTATQPCPTCGQPWIGDA